MAEDKAKKTITLEENVDALNQEIEFIQNKIDQVSIPKNKYEKYETIEKVFNISKKITLGLGIIFATYTCTNFVNKEVNIRVLEHKIDDIKSIEQRDNLGKFGIVNHEKAELEKTNFRREIETIKQRSDYKKRTEKNNKQGTATKMILGMSLLFYGGERLTRHLRKTAIYDSEPYGTIDLSASIREHEMYLDQKSTIEQYISGIPNKNIYCGKLVLNDEKIDNNKEIKKHLFLTTEYFENDKEEINNARICNKNLSLFDFAHRKICGEEIELYNVKLETKDGRIIKITGLEYN